MKKKLDAYRGSLSPAQIAEGMNVASKNARRLSKDAALLLGSGSFPTAASIAVLAIEESGKISILRGLALARSDSEVTQVWKDYRSHTRKNVTWLLPELAATGARKLDDFQPLFDETSEHPYLFDQLKQLGFYTDCLGKAHWAAPYDVIEEGLACKLVQIAGLLARDQEYTEMEVKLWIEHIGPVWKRSPSWMKQALINWSAAMQAAGLASQGSNEMEEFIRHGFGGNDAKLQQSPDESPA